MDAATEMVELDAEVSSPSDSGPEMDGGENIDASSPIVADPLPNARSPLAVNIAPFAAWTPGWVLIDAFPKSQPWVSNYCTVDDWGGGPALSTDGAGWVDALAHNQCADTSVFGAQAGHYPAGIYVLLWEGEGTLRVHWDVDPAVVHDIEDTAEQAHGLNRLTFAIASEDQTDLGIGLRIEEVGVDHIRNVRLIVPGGMCGTSMSELDHFSHCSTPRGGEGTCPEGQTCFDFEDIYWDRFRDTVSEMGAPKPVFHPVYASTYRRYRAVRYMKWTRVEESAVEDWADRVLVSDAMFTDDERGVPYEYMTAFSNLLNANAYLTVPMRATDNYVESYASLVENLLAPNLRVYVEYGNEIFNPVTPLPYWHAIGRAEESGSGIPGGDSDEVKAAKYAARRSRQVFAIWAAQMTSPEERLVRVLVGFNASNDYTTAVLDFEDAHESADALAINGYVGPNRNYVDSTVAFDAMDIDDLFQEIADGSILDAGSSLSDFVAMYASLKAMADARGLELIVYEGGNFMQFGGAGQTTIDMFYAANRDPRMGTAMVTNVQNFLTAGGTSFFYFLNEDLWSDDIASGALQFQDQSRLEAPVFDGLMTFMESTDCAWPGCAIAAPE